MMDTKEYKRQLMIKKWSAVFADQIDSGLTVQEYCAKNHIRRSSYYYWLRIVRTQMIEQQQSSNSPFVEISLPLEIQSPQENSIEPELLITDMCQSRGLTIKINNAVIEVKEDTSAALLKKVVEVLSDVK